MSARRLVRMHAEKLLRCAERRETAARLRNIDPERAEMALDDAAELLADANALREVIATMDDVFVNHPDQISLLSLGDMTR